MDPYSPEPPPSSAATSSAGSPEQSLRIGNGMAAAAAGLGTDAGSGSGAEGANCPRPAALGNAPVPTVPAACLACRNKHLKCDGLVPCSRCTSSSSECVYVASRRGYKGPKRNTAANPHKRHASSSPPGDTSSLFADAGGPTPTSLAVSGFSPAVVLPASQASTPYITTATPMTHAPNSLNLYRVPFGNGFDPGNMGLAAATAVPPAPTMSIAERCFLSFFYHFHTAHPFVLPKDYLRIARENSYNIDPLLAAIRYVGSLYLDAGPARAMYLDEALRLAYLPTTPKDGFLIQALLLTLIGLDGSCQLEKARQLLGDAERIAVEIGLNTRQFATANGHGIPVLEESWRRTWWELFVVDGMIAGTHRMTNFLLFDVPADVGLPCEEHQFLAAHIPTPLYTEDFDDQVFSGDDQQFSSFAYRIAAIKVLGRFMRCPPMISPNDENIDKIESVLTNWRIHLPPSKRDDLTKNCRLDEMMFQAHLIVHACGIILHQPHSQLDSSPARAVNSCAPHNVVTSGDAFNAHTRHTIDSACELSKMITQAVPLLSHTHFFTCVITMSSIVHLSKWALYFIHDEEDLRQLIQLNIGALSKLSTVWRGAETAAGQVKGVAQEIYRAKKAQQINPAFWVGFTQEEMITSLNTDEDIMNDIDNMLTQVTQPPSTSGL